jgi:hypothetical protein
MPTEVIDRINAYGRRDRANINLTFTRRDNTPIHDDPDQIDDDDPSERVDDDEDYIPNSESDNDEDEDDAEYDEDAQEINVNVIPDGDPANDPTRNIPIPPAAEENNQFGVTTPDHDDPPDDHGIAGVDGNPDQQELEANHDQDYDDDTRSFDDENAGGVDDIQSATPPEVETLRRSNRHQKKPDRLIETHMINDEADTLNIFGEPHTMKFKCGTRFAQIMRPDAEESDFHRVVMTQYSAKKGIKIFGEPGVRAIYEEVKQIHEMGAIEPKSNMTRDEKRQALQYLMYLKKKRCGRIKGRGCADGRKQRLYTNKHDASSPTVSLEALMISCIIDAKEKRYVVTCDVPGAFLQTKMDELVYVRFDGPMAEALIKLDPSQYKKHVTIEHGKTVIYAMLKKALYGTLRASLLFWRDLSGFLTGPEAGFTLNPYDSCVANKTIRGSQCTVLWHVDDLKISHKDPNVVETLVGMLNMKYGKRTEMVVQRGEVHDYLGMTIDLSNSGKVMIKMTDYVKGILDELPSEMNGTANTPAGPNLFETDEGSPKLSKSEGDMFHHLVAKLLFLCKRSRPDIQTAVAYLTTRVKDPDRSDWKKLARTLKYLNATRELYLTLEADSPLVIKWFVDGSFAVHPDMRSHTGAYMTMGSGMAYANSTKQRLNTRSSTEAELVAVNDVMAQVIWTRYFLRAQGYDAGPSTLYQDNMSAMLLEKNGRMSSGKRTRHINIRYFFVMDRIKSGEVTLEHCSTEDMIGDFFTKPLQGQAFYKFRKAILNLQPE